MKSKRTKATDILLSTRKIIIERDKCCIFCGIRQGLTIAHYIPRSKGGLGVKENLVLACIECHMKLDQSIERKKRLIIVKNHLQSIYKDFDESTLIYEKGKNYE